jgi:hypothetical protein
MSWRHRTGVEARRAKRPKDHEKLHALAIRMIPITEAQLEDAQVLAGD